MVQYFYYILIYFSISILFLNRNEKLENLAIEDLKEQQKITFQNPLLSSGADPWVLKQNNRYFYTHTTGKNLQLWETSSMENLGEALSKTIWTPPEGKEYSKQIWAPELHSIDGKWYMYFAATYNDGSPNSLNENRRMFVLENSSASPMNDCWEFKGKITDNTDHWAIDGTLLETEKGNYFIWSGWRTKNHKENTGRQQLYIAKMKNPWTLEGSRVMISEPEFDWEKKGLVNEGPVAWRNPEGKVFLFYSASGCWTDHYKLGVLRLTDPSDPLISKSWEKNPDPVFQKSEEHNVYGPGHNSFFKSPDGKEDWILYHANDDPGEGCGGKRKPRMQKMEWGEKGFPVLGEPKATKTEIEIPSS